MPIECWRSRSADESANPHAPRAASSWALWQSRFAHTAIPVCRLDSAPARLLGKLTWRNFHGVSHDLPMGQTLEEEDAWGLQ
jgi:hypothetical protein